MPLPPVPIVSNSECFVSGNVTIHKTAVLAPNVILQAAPHSQIIIGEGVCLGKGTILNAYAGTIEIESGAILGAGVLIIGRATVGKEACIGAATSIFNTSVESLAMIAAGSLLGDNSRNLQSTQDIKSDKELKNSDVKSDGIPSPWDEESVTKSPTSATKGTENLQQKTSKINLSPETETEKSSTEIQTETIEFVSPSLSEPPGSLQKNSVIGKVYINQLLISLFPEREAFKKSSQNP